MAQINNYQDFAELLESEDLSVWAILHMQHLFLSCCESDLLTGQGLSLDLMSFLERMYHAWQCPPCIDRLDRLEMHCNSALHQLLGAPHETLKREHVLLPFQVVREIDSKSMLWLSKQPGKSVMDKLRSSPKIQALHKRWVLDSAENQLLKAFVTQYADLLELKRAALEQSLNKLTPQHPLLSQSVPLSYSQAELSTVSTGEALTNEAQTNEAKTVESKDDESKSHELTQKQSKEPDEGKSYGLTQKLFKESLVASSDISSHPTESTTHPELALINSMLELFEHWLWQDEVQEIRPWRNLPPNNNLLSGKYYRRVWDAWTWLKNLDGDIHEDEERVESNILSMVFLGVASYLKRLPNWRLEQTPCFFHMAKLKVSLGTLDNEAFTLRGRLISPEGQGYDVKLELAQKQSAIYLSSGVHCLTMHLETSHLNTWLISLSAQVNSLSLNELLKESHLAEHIKLEASDTGDTNQQQQHPLSTLACLLSSKYAYTLGPRLFVQAWQFILELFPFEGTSKVDLSVLNTPQESEEQEQEAEQATSTDNSLSKHLWVKRLCLVILLAKQSQMQEQEQESLSYIEAEHKSQLANMLSSFSDVAMELEQEPVQEPTLLESVDNSSSTDLELKLVEPPTALELKAVDSEQEVETEQEQEQVQEPTLLETEDNSRPEDIEHKPVEGEAEQEQDETTAPSQDSAPQDNAHRSSSKLSWFKRFGLDKLLHKKEHTQENSNETEQEQEGHVESTLNSTSDKALEPEQVQEQESEQELSFSELVALQGDDSSMQPTLATVYGVLGSQEGASLAHWRQEQEEYDNDSVYPLVTIELTSIRPDYAYNGQQVHTLEQNQLSQVWLIGAGADTPQEKQEKAEVTLLDCAQAFALQLSEHKPLISWGSIYQQLISDSMLSQACQLFFEQLAAKLPCHNLWALIPDSVEEFSLQILRQQLRLQFSKSQTLPRSIGAIFALMSQQKNAKQLNKWLEQQYQLKQAPHNLSELQLVVIVASVHCSNLELTPLIGLYNQEFAQRCPQTLGWSWERHPTDVYPLDEQAYEGVLTQLLTGKTTAQPKKKNQELLSGQSLELFKQAFSVSDLIKLADSFSFLHEGGAKTTLPLDISEQATSLDLVEVLTQWQGVQYNSTLSAQGEELTSTLTKNLNKLIPAETLQKYVKQTLEHIPHKDGTNPCVLRTSKLLPAIKKDSSEAGSSIDLGVVSPVLGAQFLASLQAEASDEIFWQDHLPELKLVVRGLTFDLVKNIKITPLLGQKIVLPLPRTTDNQEPKVILPAHQQKYNFKLRRSQGAAQLNYLASLQSPRFPLLRDLKCTMKLFYTYGAENPYELWFVPEVASEQKLLVKWTPASEIPQMIPNFPAKQSWASLRVYPDTKNPSNTEDQIKSILKFMATDLPELFDSNIEKAKAKYLENRLKFLTNVIWLEGRTIKDQDAPEELKPACEALSKKLDEPLEDSKNKSARERFIFILAGMHEDLPAMVWPIFNAKASKTENLFNKGIHGNSNQNFKLGDLYNLLSTADRFGYAIGNNVLKEQHVLLKHMLKSIEFALALVKANPIKSCLEHGVYNDANSPRFDRKHGLIIISTNLLRSINIALWHNEKLIESLSLVQLKTLSDYLYLIVKDLLIPFYTQFFDKSTFDAPPQVQTSKLLCTCCELLLALLRTRASPDKDKQALWHSSSIRVEKFDALMSQVKALYLKHGIEPELKSHLRLEFSSKSSNNNEQLPILLQCVLTYLSGEDLTGEIKICGLQAD